MLREYQRQTRAHNTVVVDEKNSSEVWSTFRVADRAEVISRSAKVCSAGRILLCASHDGYLKRGAGCASTTDRAG